jgi:hypothetical protein
MLVLVKLHLCTYSKIVRHFRSTEYLAAIRMLYHVVYHLQFRPYTRKTTVIYL